MTLLHKILRRIHAFMGLEWRKIYRTQQFKLVRNKEGTGHFKDIKIYMRTQDTGTDEHLSNVILENIISPLKPGGKYTYHLFQHSVTLQFGHRIYLRVSYDSQSKQ
jgi:hypothetical protein